MGIAGWHRESNTTVSPLSPPTMEIRTNSLELRLPGTHGSSDTHISQSIARTLNGRSGWADGAAAAAVAALPFLARFLAGDPSPFRCGVGTPFDALVAEETQVESGSRV